MKPLFSLLGVAGAGWPVARLLTFHTSHLVSCKVLRHAGHRPGVQRALPGIKALFVEGL